MAKKTPEEALADAEAEKYYKEVIDDYEYRRRLEAAHARSIEQHHKDYTSWWKTVTDKQDAEQKKLNDEYLRHIENTKIQQQRIIAAQESALKERTDRERKYQDDYIKWFEDNKRITKTKRDYLSKAMESAMDEEERRERQKQKEIDDQNAKIDEAKKKTVKKVATIVSGLSALLSSMQILGTQGFALAKIAGLNYAGGVQSDLTNRALSLTQGGPVGQRLSRSDIGAAQGALNSLFLNARTGRGANNAGILQFGQTLKKVFGDTFQPTEESLRSLALTGKLTERELSDFRRSTGRARLDNNQLNSILTKNLDLFLLFGNRVSQAAVQAEQFGLSLESSVAASKGIVGDLEGTLDTVAQLNQLGANIDFAKLVRIAEFQPEQLGAFLTAAIPTRLLQSTSFRSLAESLGISDSELLVRGRGARGMSDLEERLMSDNVKNTGLLAEGITQLNQRMKILGDALGFLGPIIGFIGGAAVGGPFAPVTGLIGALVGSRSIGRTANDAVIPAGYGSRAIISPAGTLFLNNSDTIVAGTNLGGGSSAATSDTSQLIQKIDSLVSQLHEASTVIEVNGVAQRVPRMSMVGVYARQEK